MIGVEQHALATFGDYLVLPSQLHLSVIFTVHLEDSIIGSQSKERDDTEMVSVSAPGKSGFHLEDWQTWLLRHG